MKLKKIGLAVGVTLALLALGLVWDLQRGKWALAKYKTQLVKDGEILSVQPFIQKIDSSRNAGVEFGAKVASLTNSSSAIPNSLPPLFVSRDGRFMERASLLTGWTNATGDTHRWPEIEADLEHHQNVLDEVCDVLQRPSFHFGIDLTQGFLKLELNGLMQVNYGAKWLMARSLVGLRKGDTAAVFKSILALSKLVAQPDAEPLMIVQLVRHAAALSATYAVWEALEAHVHSEDQLRQLQEQWSHFEFIQDMLRSFELERNLTIDHFAQTRASMTNLEIALSNQVATAIILDLEPPDGQEALLRYVRIPLWRSGWSFQEERHCLQEWQHSLSRYRSVPTRGWAKVIETPLGTTWVLTQEPSTLSAIEKFKYLLSSGPSDHRPTTFSRAVRLQALKEIVITAIALERFRLKFGDYPRDLRALLPDFLIQPPIDWMDGEPLRYSAEGGKDYLLYSIGEDFKDDGGVGESTVDLGSGTTSFWNRKDLIWPRTLRGLN